MIDQAIEKIRLNRDRLKAAQHHQQKYYDPKHRAVEFQIRVVFVKIKSMKGINRFDQRGKLSPKYIGSFEIIRRISKMAYKLAILADISYIHNLFHISILTK